MLFFKPQLITTHYGITLILLFGITFSEVSIVIKASAIAEVSLNLKIT